MADDFLNSDYGLFGADLMTTPAGYVDLPFDWVFDVTLANAGSPGSSFVGLPLISQYDAATILRGFAVTRSPANLTDVEVRYTDAAQRYLSNQLAPLSVAAGTYQTPRPIVPNLLVPPGSVLLIDMAQTAAFGGGVLQLCWRGVKRYLADAVPAKAPRGWLDRYKEFRYSVQLSLGQRLADGFIALDDDAEFHWIGFKLTTPPTPLEAAAIQVDWKLSTNGGFQLSNSRFLAANGTQPLMRTFSAPVRIPPAGRIMVDVNEVSGGAQPASGLVTFTFVGIKRFILE